MTDDVYRQLSFEDLESRHEDLAAQVRTLLLALPKCSCGRMATKEILVPHEYTYLTCTPCAERTLAHAVETTARLKASIDYDYESGETATDLPHAALVFALLDSKWPRGLVAESEALLAILTTPRTKEEQAQHDWVTYGIPIRDEKEVDDVDP